MVGRFSLTGTVGELVVHRWSPCAAPRYIALLSHGYAEHARRYDHVAEHLTRDGAVVYAPDHVGHGRSAGQRGLVEDIEIPVTDLYLVAEDARLTYQGRPVVLVGHSMGGLIATRFAQRFRDSLAALALSGPVVGVTPGIEALFEVDQIPEVPLDPGVLSRDPAVGPAYVSDPLVYRGPFRRATLRSFVRAAEAVRAGGSLGALPLLWMHGERDQLVPLASTRPTVERVRGSVFEEKIYSGARHEVFNETNRAEVLADLTRFLDRVLAADRVSSDVVPS